MFNPISIAGANKLRNSKYIFPVKVSSKKKTSLITEKIKSWSFWHQIFWVFLPFFLTFFLLSFPGASQSINIEMGEEGSLTGRVLQIILLMTVLSLAPSILIMTTSFTRIIIVLSLLRTAMGTQQSPPNVVLISLSLFLTGFIMAPTFEAMYSQGIQPFLDQNIDETEAFERTSAPLHSFMLSNVRETDLALMMGMSQDKAQNIEDVSLVSLVPAFMISELRRAFEIGFLLYIPFIIIDMVVASILMSMGMMMLPPVMIALPFKIIFFVLVDGWALVVGSLVRSFGSVPPPPAIGG